MMMDGFFFKTLGPRLKLGRRRRSGRDMGATLAMEALEHRVLLAVTPLRLADIAFGEESSDPSQFIDVNGIVYFTASDGEAGTELWRTDGTDEGTLLVKELRFGSPYGYPAGSNPDSLTNVNGTLFFVADDGENGPELWKSDGTEEGTVLVRDINPRTLETDDYAFGSSPSNLIDVNGTLFFTADDGQHGEELWKSDGTTDGTVLVKDINPAESFGYAYGSEPSHLTAINGTLYFAANDGLNGKELWKSDGTSDGTVLVKDINPNQIEDYAYGSQISNLTNVNGTLFFAANEGEHGIELWKSDGTTDGTVLVRDINPEMAEDYAYGRGYGSSPANLTSVNGMLLFTADDGQTGSELWKSDGTVEGTVLVKDIFPGMGYSYFYNDVNDYGYTFGPYASSPQDLIPSESTGTLFFTADDGIVGRELWKSDGTEEGTVLVADLTPDDYPTYILYPTEVDGTLFFVADIADGPVVGRELWRSDGTQHGTALVADINPGEGGSYPHNLAEVNGTLFFAASDDASGVEPWTVEPGSIVRGSVFLDINANGLQDSDDVGLQAVGLFVDQNGNGQLDPSEPTASTDFNGNYAFAVDEGVHILRLQSTSGFVQTVPAGLAGHTVTVGDEDVAEQFNFGLQLIAPESVDLLDITDSGISSTDNVTNFNNSSPELAPQFLVSGVARTSFVRVRVDGEQLGVIFTDQENATVTLDGRALIEDGTHTAVADIILPSSGHEGPTTEPISFTVDTSEPVFGRPPDVTLAQVDQPFVFEATSQDMTTVTYSLAAGPTGMAVDEAGVVRWTPTLQQQGPQSFEVEAVDAAGNSARQMIEMTVLGVIPAFPDTLDAIEDETLVIDAEMGVLANDGDEQSGVLTAMIVSEPAHGTLQLNADGSLTYAPNPNFNGTDRFTYFATDGEDDTNEATVTVNVAPVNDAPEAMDDAFDAGEDQFLSVEVGIGVLANDVDVDGDEITAVLLQQPSHGSISLNPDGSFTYEPDDDFSGTDSFTYRVNDGSLESEVATVTIEVAPLNDPPIAGNDSFQTDEDSMLDVAADAGLLINDSDVDSDTLSAILVNGPTNGTVSINDDGSFSYSPIADFFGVDTFTYTATDGEAESAVATVTIDVTARPDPPSPVGDRFDVPADSESQTFAVLDNDSDPDGDQTLSVVAVTQSSAGGTVTITEDGLAVEYTPPAGFVGLDTFSYTVEDSDSLTREATVQVTVTQSASNSLSGFVYIDGNNDGQRGDGEMGVPGSILTLSGVDSQGNRSELSVLTNDDGSYRFEEVPSGTFDLVQHQPESLWDAETTTGTHGGDVSDNRISNIMLDGDQSAVDYNFGELGLRAKYISVSLHLASTPADHVVLRGLLANGEEEAGNFDLAQAIRDARSDVELPPPDRILRASNDEYQLREDELLAVDAAMGLLSNDDDGDTLTAVLVRGPERGQLSLTGDGSFTYSPDADFSGVDTFTYRSTDGNVESNEVTVTLAVDPVADPPVANADEYQVVDGEILDIGQAQGVLANDSDPDGDDLMAELVDPTFNGDVSLSGDGSFIYTPNDDFDGFDEFVYRASDGTSVSQDQTVTITSRPAVLDEAPDLVAFAQALSASGTTMFGAAWCPHCTAQKEAFEDGQHFVPFVEVTNPDRTPNQIAIDNNVVSYPTWEFPDGTRLRGQQDLQTLSERSGVPIPTSSTPFLLPIDDVTLLAGSPLHIPLDGYDPNGGRLTYSVSSDNSLVRAEVIPDNPSMRISVSGYGDMVFELFQGRARRVTDQIIELAETGFYDFVSFHRIIDGFVVQGGDPTGTGSGGSPLGDFDDQFHVDLQHNRTGILSMAKTTDDTNDSQFFITEGPQRFLDFNHSIFGQMIEGFENFAAITSVPTGAGDSPVDPVVMQSVEVFEDEENALLMLKAPEASIGEATITVTVKDEDGQIFERSINVTIEPDTRNGGPFLADIPQMQTSVDTPITFQLVGMDVEGDAIRYEARQVGEVDYAVEFDQSTGVVTVTPPAGFVGEFQVEVRVRPETFSDTNDLYDSQLVDFVVTT